MGRGQAQFAAQLHKVQSFREGGYISCQEPTTAPLTFAPNRASLHLQTAPRSLGFLSTELRPPFATGHRQVECNSKAVNLARGSIISGFVIRCNSTPARPASRSVRRKRMQRGKGEEGGGEDCQRCCRVLKKRARAAYKGLDPLVPARGEKDVGEERRRRSAPSSAEGRETSITHTVNTTA